MKRMRRTEGFTLIELLIVVAIIGIIAAIAVPGLLRARMSGNETSAIGSLRSINSAQASYSAAAGQGGYATSLAILGTGCDGSTGGGQAFISDDLNPAFATAAADGGVQKSGYRVDLTGGSVAGPSDCRGTATATDYSALAVPMSPGTTGQRGFNTSAVGTIYVDPAGGASGTTPLQ